MGRGFRWFLGLLVIAGSIWLAVRVERSGSLEAQLLERVDAVGYCDSLGGTESPVYDSTLYTSRPYMRMSDGSMTENQRCPVRQSTLNVRVQPVFVNGRAIGFC